VNEVEGSSLGNRYRNIDPIIATQNRKMGSEIKGEI
jgi:hypothetical protein